MGAQAKARTGTKTSSTSATKHPTAISQTTLGKCLYHNQFGDQNHNSKAKDNISTKASKNRVSPQASSMDLATYASKDISSQGGPIL